MFGTDVNQSNDVSIDTSREGSEVKNNLRDKEKTIIVSAFGNENTI